MARHLLTDVQLRKGLQKLIDQAKTEGKVVKLRDGGGLSLYVRGTGVCSWVRRVSVGGIKKDVTLGLYPAMSLAKARELAEESEEKKTAIVKARVQGEMNVRKLMLEWLDVKGAKERNRKDIERAFGKDVLPVIGALHPAAVTREQTDQILRTIESRNALEMLKRVRIWMNDMFEYAVDHEGHDVEVNPVRPKLRSFKQHVEGHYPAITDPREVPKLMRVSAPIEF